MDTHEDHTSLLKEGASLALDVTPFVGTGKSIGELIEGKDLVTGERINRWIAAGGIILGIIPFGKVFLKLKKASTIAKKIAYGSPKTGETLEKLEKVLSHPSLPHVNSATAKSRYQYELLRKQLRMQEGALSRAEKTSLGHDIGGHAFAKHSLSSNYKLHPTGEIRSQLGHDYGRFGAYKNTKVLSNGKVEFDYEPLLTSYNGEFIGLNKFVGKEFPFKNSSLNFNIGNREAFYKFVKQFLLDKNTKMKILEGGRIGYINTEKKIVLYDQTNQVFEGSMMKYRGLPPKEFRP